MSDFFLTGFNDGYQGMYPKEESNEPYMEGWEEGEDDWRNEEEEAYSL